MMMMMTKKKNMQKSYTQYNFSHHLKTNLVARPWAATEECRTHGFLRILWNSRKSWLTEKIKLMEEDRFLPPPPRGQPPFINWTWCLWYGIFPLTSLG